VTKWKKTKNKKNYIHNDERIHLVSSLIKNLTGLNKEQLIKIYKQAKNDEDPCVNVVAKTNRFRSQITKQQISTVRELEGTFTMTQLLHSIVGDFLEKCRNEIENRRKNGVN
jgi:hypothetical protein